MKNVGGVIQKLIIEERMMKILTAKFWNTYFDSDALDNTEVQLISGVIEDEKCKIEFTANHDCIAEWDYPGYVFKVGKKKVKLTDFELQDLQIAVALLARYNIISEVSNIEENVVREFKADD